MDPEKKTPSGLSKLKRNERLSKIMSGLRKANSQQMKCRKLSSGVDKLYLSLSITWREGKSHDLLNALDGELGRAKSFHQAQQGQLKCKVYKDPWYYKLQPFSTKNYQYILISHDYTVRISTRQDFEDNVFIEVRSEALWSLGYREAVDKIISYLKPYASSIKVKINCVDLCADIETPKAVWSKDLIDKIVCPASHIDPHMDKSNGNIILAGITIGRGKILARIYNKVKEIDEHPKKLWTYSLWDIDKPNSQSEIIRVEFQLRGAALKTFLINDLKDLYEGINSLWAYLTREWLKFIEKPQKNKERQKVIPWWKCVQNSFGENIEPLVRVRHEAIKMEQDQLAKRALSYIINLMASEVAYEEDNEHNDHYKDIQITLKDCMEVFLSQLKVSDEEIAKRVRDKIVEYKRFYD